VERILVGLDASTRAAAVLSAVAELAEASGAKLVLFRAVGIPRDLPKEALSITSEKTQELLEQLGRRDLEALAASVPDNVGFEIRIQVGTPWRSICAAAEEIRADMIIIGSHGYEGLDRLLGTTAAKVVNHAPCSVLALRPPIPR
jgi:nucleotide-binding universal stress UspA family protein